MYRDSTTAQMLLAKDSAVHARIDLLQRIMSAQSGHADMLNQCPLSGVKRTSLKLVSMSRY
jgi:hypothetical protein